MDGAVRSGDTRDYFDTMGLPRGFSKNKIVAKISYLYINQHYAVKKQRNIAKNKYLYIQALVHLF